MFIIHAMVSTPAIFRAVQKALALSGGDISDMVLNMPTTPLWPANVRLPYGALRPAGRSSLSASEHTR